MNGPDERTDGWPVALTGVTETVVTTRGPNGRWNVAALGLFGPDGGNGRATAITWGNTRTRRNFRREGSGYVQFVTDPVVFVDAALSVVEVDSPILESANAWARISVERVGSGIDRGTRWERWAIDPVETAVLEERVPTIDRGVLAVVEASVHASRLGVPGYEDSDLRRRLTDCAGIVERTGGPRERMAMDRIARHVDVEVDVDADTNCDGPSDSDTDSDGTADRERESNADDPPWTPDG